MSNATELVNKAAKTIIENDMPPRMEAGFIKELWSDHGYILKADYDSFLDFVGALSEAKFNILFH